MDSTTLTLSGFQKHISERYEAADRAGMLIWTELPNWQELTEAAKRRILGQNATGTQFLVDWDTYQVLGVRPHVGRFFGDDEAGESNPGKLAVIGYSFWRRHFGARRDVEVRQRLFDL